MASGVSLSRSASGESNPAFLECKGDKANELLAHIFEQNVGKSPDPLASGNAINTSFSVANSTWFSRAIEDQLSTILASFPSQTPFLKEITQELSAPNTAVAYHAMGTTTAFHALYATTMLVDNFDQIAFAEKIGDSQGKLLGRLAAFKNISFIGGAAGYAGYRPLSIATAVTGTATGYTAPTLLGRVAAGFGLFGNIFYAIYYAAVALLSSVQIYFGEKFRNKMNASETVEAKLQFLKDQLKVDPDKMYRKLLDKEAKKVHGDLFQNLDREKQDEILQTVKAAVINEMIAHGSEIITQIFAESGEKMSQEHCRRLFLNLVQSRFSELQTKEYIPQFMNEYLFMEGLQLKMRKLELKKELKLARLTSADCVKMIKEANVAGKIVSIDGAVRPISEDNTAQKIVDTVVSALNFKRDLNIVGVIACVVGVISMILAIVFSGGIGAVIGAVISLVAVLLMLGLDGYCMKMSLDSEPVGRNDKKVLLTSTALCLLSAGVVVGLMASGVVSFGILPLVLTLVLAAVWLGHNGYAWYIINQKEKKHPTIESFLQFLQKEQANEKIAELFDRLPMEVQELLKQQLEKDSGEASAEDWKAAIAKVQRMKEEHFERLREELLAFE